MSTSSDRSWIRMYEELNLNKNFVIITFDNFLKLRLLIIMMHDR